MKRPPPTLVEFLSRYDPAVRDLALSARRTVLGEVPSASETVNDVSYAVSNAFTFSGRFKEAFCYVVTYPAHVNLGFNRGTELADPDGLLKGTGKLHRHVRVGSQADLKNPALRRLIQAAADQAAVIFRK